MSGVITFSLTTLNLSRGKYDEMTCLRMSGGLMEANYPSRKKNEERREKLTVIFPASPYSPCGSGRVDNILISPVCPSV